MTPLQRGPAAAERPVVSNSLQPHGLWPPGSSVHGILPGNNTGPGCHFLLQGIFPSQGLNLRLLHWQAGSLPLATWIAPMRS